MANGGAVDEPSRPAQTAPARARPNRPRATALARDRRRTPARDLILYYYYIVVRILYHIRYYNIYIYIARARGFFFFSLFFFVLSRPHARSLAHTYERVYLRGPVRTCTIP